MIVDFEIPDRFVAILDRVVETRGRIILAGTPSIHTAGFTRSTNAVLERMQKPGVKGLVMGGDTAADVQFSGTVSAGGGSALYFVANGRVGPGASKKKEMDGPAEHPVDVVPIRCTDWSAEIRSLLAKDTRFCWPFSLPAIPA